MNYEETLYKLLANDDRFIVLTAENRAAIRNLPGLIKERFIDTGITEQTLVGTAAGLALRGRIPIVHALSTFLTMRAFEFIRTDIGIGQLPVKLIGAVPGFLSEANGPTHQAIEDVSLMRGIPGVNIFCPADEQDLKIGLEKVLKSPAPYYIRYTNFANVIEHNPDFQIGKAEVISEGLDITILVYGTLLREAIIAKDILAEQGISVGLLNMRTVKPIDVDAIVQAASQSSLIVTIEDHFLTGGLFSIVSEVLVKEQTCTRVLPIALKDKWFKPALLNDVLEYEGFTGRQLAEKIKIEFETDFSDKKFEKVFD
ncbi:MAG: transketolase [Ignavibacteriales bacterium]|nr:MAG: transketolase [Ignavibacteriales bacterium]